MSESQRPDIKAAIEALAECVLGERADKHLLWPMLVTTLSVDVRDFLTYHPAEFAEMRVRDHEILVQHERFRKQLNRTSP